MFCLASLGIFTPKIYQWYISRFILLQGAVSHLLGEQGDTKFDLGSTKLILGSITENNSGSREMGQISKEAGSWGPPPLYPFTESHR